MNNRRRVEEFTAGYYGLCAAGGMLSTGVTHLLITPFDVLKVKTQCWTVDVNRQLEATAQFRKLLSIESGPPIQEVIQSGVVPCFVEFLMYENIPQLQFEAAWTLTNIASGTSKHTKVAIDHGAVPIFVRLLISPSDEVREQAIWALGNVASDSPNCRDLVLGHGALAQLNEHAKLSMLRNASCAF